MDPSKRDLYSSTEMEALLAAASGGDLPTLERLLRHSVNIDTRGYLKGTSKEFISEPTTMLEAAASHNQLEMMEYLIRKGADVNWAYDGETALLTAAYQGRVQVLSLLIENGADINCKRFRGASVLHEAVHNVSADNLDRKIAVVEILLSHGFDIETTDVDGHTALHCVGNLQIAEILVNKGADVNAKSISGDRPLDRAAVGGDLEIATFLIQKEAQVNNKEEGCSGLGLAARNGYTSMVALLLDHGAKAIIPRYKNYELLAAARSGTAATVSLLYERGFVHQGRPSLFMAILVDPLNVVELLLAQGVNINARSRKGQSVLHFAVLRRPVDRTGSRGVLLSRWEVLQFLLDKGADIEARDVNGQTAKDLATASNYVEAVGILEPRTIQS